MDFSTDESLAVCSKSLVFARKLSATLQSLDHLDFPTEASQTASEVLIRALNELVAPANLTPMDPAVLYNRLHEVHRLVGIVEASSTDRISWPLVSYCDAIWKELFGSNGPAVFYSVTPAYNYTLVPFTSWLSAYLKGLLPQQKIDSVVDGTELYCLQLASSEDDNLPLYANIGHEFGHAMFQSKRQEIVQILDQKLTAISQSIQHGLTADYAADAPRLFLRIGAVLLWIAEELFCDMIGAVLMGPAFLLSLYEVSWGKQNKAAFTVSLSPNNAFTIAYPSTFFRLHCIQRWSNLTDFCKHLNTELERAGLKSLIPLSNSLDTIPATHDSDVVIVKPDSDPDAVKIKNCLKDHLPDLKSALEEFVADCNSQIASWFPNLTSESVKPADVAQLLLRLTERVLPNVVPDATLLGRRATFAAILNASALYRLQVLLSSENKAAQDVSKQIALIERLTAKAFEVSYIHHEFHSWKGA